MAMFYVEKQPWQHWPKVLTVCLKNGDGTERRRYVPERTCEDVAIEGEWFECSECGTVKRLIRPNFCPKCGRRVVG